MVSATALFASALTGEVKDAKGHYSLNTVPTGNCRVALFVNGLLKASINNTRILADKPTELNFALTGKAAPNQSTKKGKHMVYVPAETGSHLPGRWVEVDDNGDNEAVLAGDNIRKGSNADIARMWRNRSQ